MLDAGLEDSAREALATDVRNRIAADGVLKHENNWGLRKMAYEIDQRNEADYRWFRFEAPRELLGELDHNMKIVDGILRFRLFKVDPEAPVIAPPASGSAPAAARSEPQAPAAPAAAAPAPEAPAPEAAAEAPSDAEAAPAAEAAPEAPAEEAEAPRPAVEEAAPAEEPVSDPAPAPDSGE